MSFPPRLRFAPSPTGYLHVGGARTALFNWLYARKHGGTFVLRIEDTDAERSSWEMVTGIVEGLRWLGLDWDEGPDVGGPHGPYFQSERLEKYRTAAEQLVRGGHGYYCYCAPEALKAEREAAEATGGGWSYDRRCARLEAAEIARREARGEPRAVRFLVPEGKTVFADLVHGPVEFDNAVIEDFVVLRRDGHPTYHLSVVVDDIDMAITHVVRGDDHVSNTPKQVLLYGAFGQAVPAFAHVPLILGPDKRRLSKRHGATSVTEYARQGFLPEAMVNFLALLGWSPGGDRELLSREELIEAFALEGISSSNAVFNPEKLAWFNGQHLGRLADERIVAVLRPGLEAAGIWDGSLAGDRREYLLRVVELLKPRLRMPADVAAIGRYFFAEPEAFEPAAVAKHLSSPEAGAWVAALERVLAGVEPFEPTSIERAVRAEAEAAGVKAASLIHAARIAVTGQAVSPGVFEVLALVGRPAALARLARLESFLAARPDAAGPADPANAAVQP